MHACSRALVPCSMIPPKHTTNLSCPQSLRKGRTLARTLPSTNHTIKVTLIGSQDGFDKPLRHDSVVK
jgi:hypothetical protein